jgi:hypothetical protein
MLKKSASDARTPLADCFSILPVIRHYQPTYTSGPYYAKTKFSAYC